MPVMPTLRDLGEEDSWELEAGLGYIASIRPTVTNNKALS